MQHKMVTWSAILAVGLLTAACTDKENTNSAGLNKAVMEFFKPLYKQPIAGIVTMAHSEKGEAELIAAHPLTGKQIHPCRPRGSADPSQYPAGTPECRTRMVNRDGRMQLFKLDEAGNETEAEILGTKTITMVEWRGSHCTTIFSGGSQLENCITLEDLCQALLLMLSPSETLALAPDCRPFIN